MRSFKKNKNSIKNLYSHPRNPTADNIMEETYKHVKYNTINDAILSHSTANLDDIIQSPYFKSMYTVNHILSNRSGKVILKVKNNNGVDLVAKIYFSDTGHEHIKEIFDILKYNYNQFVMKFVDLVIENNYWYKVSEYYGDTDLKKYVDDDCVDDIVDVFLQIATGLKHLHDNDIVHCDIKLENVLMYNGKIKIIDFELSRRTNECITCDYKFGTTFYMSPETRDLFIHSKKTDIWELGVLLYYMITKSFPISINDESYDDHLYRKNCYKYPKTKELLHVVNLKKLPISLYLLVCKMLEFNDSDRPTIDEIVDWDF